MLRARYEQSLTSRILRKLELESPDSHSAYTRRIRLKRPEVRTQNFVVSLILWSGLWCTECTRSNRTSISRGGRFENYLLKCCGSGSGGSVINLPPESSSGSMNSVSRIRFRILTPYQDTKFFLKKVVYFTILIDLLYYLFYNIFINGYKNVHVGCRPPESGPVIQDNGSADPDPNEIFTNIHNTAK